MDFPGPPAALQDAGVQYDHGLYLARRITAAVEILLQISFNGEPVDNLVYLVRRLGHALAPHSCLIH